MEILGEANHCPSWYYWHCWQEPQRQRIFPLFFCQTAKYLKPQPLSLNVIMTQRESISSQNGSKHSNILTERENNCLEDGR